MPFRTSLPAYTYPHSIKSEEINENVDDRIYR